MVERKAARERARAAAAPVQTVCNCGRKSRPDVRREATRVEQSDVGQHREVLQGKVDFQLRTHVD